MATQAQPHLHLDTNLDGAPENGPTLYFTALASPREVITPTPHVAVEWAVDATPLVHQATSGGSVLSSQTRAYRLRLTRTEVTSLRALEGEYCYFVPPYHPDDGSDHTASRVQVYFVALRNLVNEKTDMAYYQGTIVLQYAAA